MLGMLKLRVMIVDDVSIMRTLLKEILVDHCEIKPGKITEAADGKEAILMYEQCRPDIVFLDITMPDLNGKEVVKKLKEIDSDARIIMYTGSGDKMSVIECIRAGAKDYVRKPPEPERILKALEKALDMGLDADDNAEVTWRNGK